jgi:hypothetical protein
MAPTTLDISSLPETARAELADFYEFLKTKYRTVSGERSEDVAAFFAQGIPSFLPLSREDAHAR